MCTLDAAFDLMPLLIQYHPDTAPMLMYLPKQYCPTVPLSHPRYHWFAGLRLWWYAIPVVSNFKLSVGGLSYTAAPFNGWYSVTEIMRNLTDPDRYNMAALVASKMGLDTCVETSLWRDLAMSEIGVAILHSFASLGFALTDHHTMLSGFWDWYNKEKKNRGYCPGNWKYTHACDRTDGQTDGWTEWRDGRTGGQSEGRENAWAGGQAGGQVGWQTGGRADGRTGGRADEQAGGQADGLTD